MEAGECSAAEQPRRQPRIRCALGEGERILAAGGAVAAAPALRRALPSFGLPEAPSLEDLENLADTLFVDPHPLGLQEKTREERGCTLILLFPVCSPHTPPLQNSFIPGRHQLSFPCSPLGTELSLCWC